MKQTQLEHLHTMDALLNSSLHYDEANLQEEEPQEEPLSNIALVSLSDDNQELLLLI